MKINKKVSSADIKITIDDLDKVVAKAKENTDKAISKALKAKKAKEDADKKGIPSAPKTIDNPYLSAFKQKFAKYQPKSKKEIFDLLKDSIGSCILYKAIKSFDPNNTDKQKLFYDFASYGSGLNLPCAANTKTSSIGLVVFYNEKLPISERFSYLNRISDINDAHKDNRCRFFSNDRDNCKDAKYHKGISLLEDSRRSLSKIIYRSDIGVESLDPNKKGSYMLKDSSRSIENTVKIHNIVTRYTKDQIKQVAKIICEDPGLNEDVSKEYHLYYGIICPFVKEGTLDSSRLADGDFDGGDDLFDDYNKFITNNLTFDSCASEMSSYFLQSEFLLMNS